MPRRPTDRPYVCGPYRHGARWRLVFYTPDGFGRKVLHRSFATEAEAKRFKREFRRHVAAGQRTVEATIEEYLEHLKRKRGNKSGSVTTSGYRLRRLLDGDMAIVDLTPRRAQDLYETMIEEGYERAGKAIAYSVDAHQDSLMEAKAFARFCVNKRYLASNPFERVEPEGKKKKRKAQLRIDESRTFVRYCLSVWNETQDRRAIAALLPMQHNLRASEVAELAARDVDDNGRILWVAFGETELGEDVAKTRSSKRAARIAPHLQGPMRWLAKHPATPDGRLFAKESGAPADRHWVLYWVREFCKDAGVPEITAHGLRGTYASIRKLEGASDEQIADEMGHSDTGSTARGHYIDPEISAQAQDAKVAATLFDGIPEAVDPETTPKIARSSTPDPDKDPVLAK